MNRGRYPTGGARRASRVGVAKRPRRARASVCSTKLPVDELRRIAAKLDEVAGRSRAQETSRRRRPASRARGAGRSTRASRAARRALTEAIDEAGAVYLPERLHAVRIARQETALRARAVGRGRRRARRDADLRMLQARAGTARPPARSAGADRSRAAGAGVAGAARTHRLARARRARRRARGRLPAAARAATCATRDAPDARAADARRRAHCRRRRAATARRRAADQMPGPYELYLIRHGVAEERGEAWPDDAKRPLTEDGIVAAAQGGARAGAARRRVRRRCSPARWSARGRPPRSSPAASSRARPSSPSSRSRRAAAIAAVLADLEKHARKRAHRAGRPRAGHRRAGGAADRLAPSDRVQEGRGLPDRRRDAAAGRPRRPALVPDAEDPADAAKMNPRASDRGTSTPCR